MPIYEYLCEACGKVNERLQKVTDPAPTRCDQCGSRKLAKLVSRSAFQLKGGGWYSDLYASPKPGSASKEPSGEASATAPEKSKSEAATAKKEPPASAKEGAAKKKETASGPRKAGGKKPA